MSHIGQGDEPLERPVPDGWPGYVSPALRALPHLWPESIVQYSCTEPVISHNTNTLEPINTVQLRCTEKVISVQYRCCSTAQVYRCISYLAPHSEQNT